jgi:hypothetical protein
MIHPLITNITDAFSGKAPLGVARSGKWATVRKHFLEANPTCAVCGGTDRLEVHHIFPFHLDPEKELDPTNLITLCEGQRFGLNCHLLMGHLGSFRDVNPDVTSDAKIWNQKLSKRK